MSPLVYFSDNNLDVVLGKILQQVEALNDGGSMEERCATLYNYLIKKKG